MAVVGGGAVGLACSRAILKSQPELSLAVLERNERLGAENTARNSEVIHAGIYYGPGSLKEALCIEGRDLLYAYCRENQIEHRNCGKLIVGQAGEESELEAIVQRCARLNVPIEQISSTRLHALEPLVSAKSALFSPTTGIVSSEELVQSLARETESLGGMILKRTPVMRAERSGKGFELQLDDYARTRVRAQVLVNAAGWGAYPLSQQLVQIPRDFEMRYVKGHYFKLSSRHHGKYGHLIYPCPDHAGGGLGIHLTLDLGGGARLGPDTQNVAAPGVAIDLNSPYFDFPPGSALSDLQQKFFEAARRYLPDLQPTDLSPDYTGIRTKRVSLQTGKFLDFSIRRSTEHGVPGLIDLLGIESPGLTSSLAIGRWVANWVKKETA